MDKNKIEQAKALAHDAYDQAWEYINNAVSEELELPEDEEQAEEIRDDFFEEVAKELKRIISTNITKEQLQKAVQLTRELKAELSSDQKQQLDEIINILIKED